MSTTIPPNSQEGIPKDRVGLELTDPKLAQTHSSLSLQPIEAQDSRDSLPAGENSDSKATKITDFIEEKNQPDTASDTQYKEPMLEEKQSVSKQRNKNYFEKFFSWKYWCLPFNRFLDKSYSLFLNKNPVRIVYFVFLLGAISSVFWSYQVRYQQMLEQEDIEKKISKATADLSTLMDEVSNEDKQELENNVKKAEEKILNNYQALAHWLSDQVGLAEQQQFIFNYQIQSEMPSNIAGVSIVSIEASLTNQDSALSARAYTNSLKFLKNWIEDNIYLQVDGLSVTSMGSGINRMNMKINVWVKNQS